MINNKTKGFSLIELSIVLIIIGLIAGAVVGGKKLINNARIVAQVSQIQEFQVAYNNFKLAYDEIPGDFSRASDYWPGVPNGDGNGRITHHCDQAFDISHENIKFFQHLSEAELVDEEYTNVWQIGAGYPELKLNDDYGMVSCGSIRNFFETHRVQLSSASAQKPYTALLALNVSTPEISGLSYNDDIGTSSPKTYLKIDKK